MKIKRINGQLQQHAQEAVGFLEDKGLLLGRDYFLSYIALQGSQNYGIDHEGSDVDSKLMVSPTKRALLLKKSFTYDVPTSSGEICVVRPTMEYLEILFKGNINAMEVLYTPYHVYYQNSTWEKLRHSPGEFEYHLKEDMLKATLGNMRQKFKSMTKPTGGCQEEFFEEMGYNGKDFLHLLRFGRFIEDISSGMSYKQALWWNNQTLAEAIRGGQFDQYFATKMAKAELDKCEQIVDSFVQHCGIPVEEKQAWKERVREKVADWENSFGQFR